MTGKKPGLSVDREADNTGMIVEVRGSKVILNKKQLAICFAPRKYETETVITVSKSLLTSILDHHIEDIHLIIK